MVKRTYNKSTKPAKNNIVIPVQNIGKIDINMPDFCFGIIGKMEAKDQPQSIEIFDAFDPNKKIVITRGSFGFPNQSTRDTLMVLMRLAWKKKKLGSRSTPITAYEIFSELGQQKGGSNLKRLKHNLDILQQTQIKYINSLFDKETGKSSQGVFAFSILGSYYIKEMGIEAPDFIKTEDEEMWNGHVTWEENFFKGIMHNGKNLISIDHAKYMSLSKDIAKQLFLFLSKRAYNSDMLRIPLVELARNKLGINQTRSLSKIKYDLKSVHQSLVELNILAIEPEYYTHMDQDWLEYTFAKHNSLKLRKNQEAYLSDSQEVGKIIESLKEDYVPESLEDEKSVKQKPIKSGSQEVVNDTKQRFLNLGLTEANYGKMYKKYSKQKILDGLDLLDLEIRGGAKIRSPKKWFLACINQDFDTNSLFADREQTQKDNLEKMRLELEQKNEQARLEKEQAQDLIRNKAIDEWITQNPFEFVEECEKHVEELMSKGGVMAKKLTQLSSEQNVKPTKVIVNHPMYAGTLRKKLWAKMS